ncbi:MAG: hypothetical protein IJO94_00990 [Firmicutes bacterium]|nr:hypothetical protein [Bacillota bacterium]
MCRISKEMLKDCSTPTEFRFSFACSECGEEWKSTPVPFSKAGESPKTEGKKVIFDILYQREKEAALFLAEKEAAGVFNVCPICHRLVCDHCFLICKDLDMCRACSDRLEEDGECVAHR